jgi:hypothetical protein
MIRILSVADSPVPGPPAHHTPLTRHQLEFGLTGDPIWNAAQLEMVHRGEGRRVGAGVDGYCQQHSALYGLSAVIGRAMPGV